MIRFFEQIIRLLIIVSQMQQFILNRLICVSDCIYLNNQIYFTNQQYPQIDIEQNLSLLPDENVGFGFWTKYQPYRKVIPLSMTKVFETIDTYSYTQSDYDYFLYSITKKIEKKNILIVSQELNQNEKTIVHKVFYDFQKEKKTISFPFEIDGYEGSWILFYIYFNQLEGTTTFGFYHFELNTPIRSVIINDLPGLADTLIHQSGGFQYYINQEQQIKILNQFLGVISCGFSAGSFDFETSIFQCSESTAYDNYFDCEWDQIPFNIFDQDLLGDIYFNTHSISEQNPKYQITGWVKLNQLQEVELETMFIRISINEDYGDDSFIGDRDLFIKYFQNIDPKLNGFEINTYSYQFPIKGRYQTPNELKVKVFGTEYYQAITKWHFIQYTICYKNENYQPLYEVYFPDFDEIKQFRFPVQIQHFTGNAYILHLGGDEFSKKYMRGKTYDLAIFFPCDDLNPDFIINCDYSCLECFGPTKYDCLSCSSDSFRVLTSKNTCICKPNYIDFNFQMICQSIEQGFPQITVEEIPLNCDIEGYDICDQNLIQCSFGYFKHENTCMKCPNYEDINSKIRISCFDYFIDPESFGQTLVCTKYAQTFQESVENSYQINNRNEEEYTYYFIVTTHDGQKQLQLCEGCNETSCKYGYFLKDGKCVKCLEGCSKCENEVTCKSCFETHLLSENQTCFCQEDCRISLPVYDGYCEIQDNDKCYYCFGDPKKYYLTFQGNICSYCNIDNCQYCFQYIKVGDQYMTTLDIQFKTYKNNEVKINLGCALCESNYYFNFNTNKCELKPEDNDCEFAIIEQNNNLKCIIGSTENNAIQVSDCSELQHCKQCIKDYIQSLTFCIVCMDGYYASLQSGQCLACRIGCKSCYYQNYLYGNSWKQYIRAFYKYFVNYNGEHSFEKFANFYSLVDMSFFLHLVLINIYQVIEFVYKVVKMVAQNVKQLINQLFAQNAQFTIRFIEKF